MMLFSGRSPAAMRAYVRQQTARQEEHRAAIAACAPEVALHSRLVAEAAIFAEEKRASDAHAFKREELADRKAARRENLEAMRWGAMKKGEENVTNASHGLWLLGIALAMTLWVWFQNRQRAAQMGPGTVP